ncbi:hypothetical protein [Butyrivibrio sp. AE2032]|uniref:hypothetical protein n=1 Tax=Butyrivibrio sp. AE2032 TaxID=1458463 RepID=UPI000557E028|nr:hypothetical protein [Butyrivibrio sp. AE2032]
MWKEYSFSEGDSDLFRKLIPDYCMKELESGELSGIVFINHDSKVDPVVGIILYRYTRGYIEIEWVTTTVPYDLPVYGADMVRLFVYRCRIRGGVRGVFCKFREDDGMAEYFPERDFVWSRVNSGVYRFRLADVASLPEKKHSRMENCVSLKDADRELQNNLLKRVEKSETIVPMPHPVKWDIYDQEISAIYSENGMTHGAVLVDKDGDELVIRLLYSENPIVAITLLQHALKVAVAKYGKEQTVTCPVINEVSESLVKKIVIRYECDAIIRAQVNISPGTGRVADLIRYASAAGRA